MAVRLEADPALISPDYSIEKFKTATRVVPVSAVISGNASLMGAAVDEYEDPDLPDELDEIEEAEEVVEAKAPAAPAAPRPGKRRSCGQRHQEKAPPPSQEKTRHGHPDRRCEWRRPD